MPNASVAWGLKDWKVPVSKVSHLHETEKWMKRAKYVFLYFDSFIGQLCLQKYSKNDKTRHHVNFFAEWTNMSIGKEAFMLQCGLHISSFVTIAFMSCEWKFPNKKARTQMYTWIWHYCHTAESWKSASNCKQNSFLLSPLLMDLNCRHKFLANKIAPKNTVLAKCFSQI